MAALPDMIDALVGAHGRVEIARYLVIFNGDIMQKPPPTEAMVMREIKKLPPTYMDHLTEDGLSPFAVAAVAQLAWDLPTAPLIERLAKHPVVQELKAKHQQDRENAHTERLAALQQYGRLHALMLENTGEDYDMEIEDDIQPAIRKINKRLKRGPEVARDYIVENFHGPAHVERALEGLDANMLVAAGLKYIVSGQLQLARHAEGRTAEEIGPNLMKARLAEAAAIADKAKEKTKQLKLQLQLQGQVAQPPPAYHSQAADADINLVETLTGGALKQFGRDKYTHAILVNPVADDQHIAETITKHRETTRENKKIYLVSTADSAPSHKTQWEAWLHNMPNASIIKIHAQDATSAKMRRIFPLV